MFFHDKFKNRVMARGPDCGCGGTCPTCQYYNGRLIENHSFEISQTYDAVIKPNEEKKKD